MTEQSVQAPLAATEDCWWVYLIRTAKGALYCGISKDVERRLSEHESGTGRGAKALRGKGPLELVYSRPVGHYADALKVEYRIKQLASTKKRALVQGCQDTESAVGLRS